MVLAVSPFMPAQVLRLESPSVSGGRFVAVAAGLKRGDRYVIELRDHWLTGTWERRRDVGADGVIVATPDVAGLELLPPLPLLPGGGANRRFLRIATLTPMVVWVDPLLADAIRADLEVFRRDLGKVGYQVLERSAPFGTPSEVRAFLRNLHAETDGRLAGAILIGDIPYAYQFVEMRYSNPQIPPLREEVISLQYYCDLDGSFDRSPAYASPGKHEDSFDLHAGPVDWEIWIGVLPLYKGRRDLTVEALHRYFAKNHAYRAGTGQQPQRFLQVSEHFRAGTMAEHDAILAGMRSGVYAWTPFSNEPDARLQFDSVAAGFSVDQGYADLSAGLADFTVTDTHGYWGAAGRLTVSWVENRPVRTTFFWSNGCAVGNLDWPDNFLAAVLYSASSTVLVAKGTTNDSGGMGNNQNGFFGHNVATSLVEGRSMGQAILDHVNVPLAWPWSDSREFHFATSIVLGDPTLRAR